MEQSAIFIDVHSLQSPPTSLPRRDAHADSDTSLIRKRPRIGDDEKTPASGNCDLASGTTSVSTSPIPSHSPRIEMEIVNEESDPPYTTMINLEHDLSFDADGPESFPFIKDSLPTPDLAAAALLDHIREGNSLSDDTIIEFVDWLEDQGSADRLDRTSKSNNYVGWTGFWNSIGCSMCLLSKRRSLGQLFKLRESRAYHLFTRLIKSYASLCAILMQIELEELQRTSARRDSIKPENCPSYRPRFSNCIEGLVLLLDSCTLWKSFSSQRNFSTDVLRRDGAESFLSRTGGLVSMASLFETVASNPDEMQGGFSFLKTHLNLAVALLHAARPALSTTHTQSCRHLVKIFSVANQTVLPKLIKVNPRNLHQLFHRDFCDVLDVCLGVLVHLDSDLVTDLYGAQVDSAFENGKLEQLDRTSSNAIPATAQHHIPLREACRNHLPVCALEAWNLNIADMFLKTSVVELRVHGIETFNKTLIRAWNAYKANAEDCNHPVLRFLAVSLVANRIVERIFGKDIHVDVIRRSANTVTFLLYTGYYTNADLDIIWKSVVMSNQAEVLETGIAFMIKILNDMQHDTSIFYLVSKFESLPLSQFTKPTMTLLASAIKLLQSHSTIQDDTYDTDILYESAIVLIHLLQKLSATHIGPELHVARSEILTGLTSIMEPSISQKCLEKLVRVCLLSVGKGLPEATGSVQAIVVFCNLMLTRTTPKAMFIVPFSVALEELCQYVRMRRSDQLHAPDAYEFLSRLQLVMCLLPMENDEAMESQLWDHIAGKNSINNLARMWAFDAIARASMDSAEMRPFFARCLIKYLPRFPIEHVNPGLINFYQVAVRISHAYVDPHLFVAALHDQIPRLMFAITDQTSVGQLTGIIVECLFYRPASKSPKSTIPAQISMVDCCIRTLGQEQTHRERALQLLSVLVDESGKSESKDRLHNSERASLVMRDVDVTKAIKIPIEVHGGRGSASRMNLLVAEDTTLGDIISRLQAETGHNTFQVFIGGQVLHLDAGCKSTVKEYGLHEKGQMILREAHSAESLLADRFDHEGTAVERQILLHFDEIYAQFDSEPELGREIYGLLTRLRPPKSFQSSLLEEQKLSTSFFPTDRPWKTMYTIKALDRILQNQIKLGVADGAFLLHGVRILVDLLLQDQTMCNVMLLRSVVESLNTFLQKRPVQDRSAFYFEKPAEFLDRLYKVIHHLEDRLDDPSLTQLEIDDCQKLIHLVYACLMEGVRLSTTLQEAILTTTSSASEHKKLLSSQYLVVSQVVAKGMQNLSGEPKLSATLKTWFWNVIFEALSSAHNEPTLSGPIYAVAPQILLANKVLITDESAVRSLFNHLAPILAEMKHQEVFGFDFVDHRVRGLVNLLQSCILCLESLDAFVDTGSFCLTLFSKFLFPSSKDGCRPIANVETRKCLYELTLATCNEQDYESLVGRAKELVNRNVDSDLPYYDRSNFLRADCGLLGLENLGQTCYMNSLLQQLFMNEPFRTFVLQSRVEDISKQQVLYEFQFAFAHMQGSYSFQFSPSKLAQVLDVDIGSQEDAHIFFTTLIGKLEDSMADEEAKKQLRAFFGGRNKSQTCGECGHVSESTDEYYNLSLVVKNKAGLLESLQEYVEGAPLEGGDKFKCMRCESEGKDSYVNAMRRTGLEHIPDNLVLGLKRFRYETFDGGTKVNDRFEFPERIDMSPYKLTHLADATEAPEEDIFELVGTIVHQGTLQFGHYWSFTRDRKREGKGRPGWVRLEDSSANFSDLETVMKECCGGPVLNANGSTSDRSDSAYILFYQRISRDGSKRSGDGKDQTFGTEIAQPATTSEQDRFATIPESLRDDLHKHNDTVVHATHLFDPRHTRFVQELLERARWTGDSGHEMLGLHLAINHLSSVVIHQQALDGCESLVMIVGSLAEKDQNHALAILDHLSKDTTTANFLLHGKLIVRQIFNDLVIKCLQLLREKSPNAYGAARGGSIITDHRDKNLEPGMIYKVVMAHYKILPQLADHRGIWSTYFDLVVKIAGFGVHETALLLDTNWLVWSLRVLYIRHDEYARSTNRDIWAHLQAHRRYAYHCVADCIYGLLKSHVCLENMEFRVEGVNGKHIVVGDLCFLNEEELELLKRDTNGRSCLVHDACCYGNVQPNQHWSLWPPAMLMGLLTEKGTDPSFAQFVAKSIINCINDKDIYVPYVMAGISCCSSSLDISARAEIVDCVAFLGKNFDNTYENVFHFMREVFSNNRFEVLLMLKVWLPPSLFCNVDEIEQAAVTWVRKHVYSRDIDTHAQNAEELRLNLCMLRATKELCIEVGGRLERSRRNRDDRGVTDHALVAYTGGLSHLRRCRLLLVEAQGFVSGRAQPITDEEASSDVGGSQSAPSSSLQHSTESKLQEELRAETLDIDRCLSVGSEMLKRFEDWGELSEEVSEMESDA